jgi:hypothetical protein
MISSADKAIMIKSSLIPQKTTRSSVGTTLMTLKTGQTVTRTMAATENDAFKGYRKIKIPATGVTLAESDLEAQQIKMDV